MRRHLLGIISLCLILAAIYGLFTHGVGDDQTSMMISMCLRIGMILGAIWLAFPQLIRMSASSSPWTMILIGAIMLAIVIRPKTIVVLGPILLLLGMLHLAGRVLKPNSKR